MLRTQWGTRSPSAACISGQWRVLEVAGVVGPRRAPRAGQQTSMHHAVEREVVVEMARTSMVVEMSIK
jgi:hypothetical protein